METASPSSQGVNADGITELIEMLEEDPRIEPHGLIVQRHGKRIAEGAWAPHTTTGNRLVYSLSKTFTGTALALALGESRLSLDDLVSDHLPELFDGVDPATRRMRIRHIASMATGHDRETWAEAQQLDPDDAVRGFLHIPPDAEPGTLFAYNQPPVMALARILQRLTGERLVDYLTPRALDPLGIADLRWARLPDGCDMGFSGVYTNLEAIARLGQLYLDDGVHDGARLLPEGWVAQASSVQIPNPQREEPDWQQGYGFQLWMSQHGYRGDGAYGQYMVVLPEQDAVIAVFSCTEQMQAVLDLMWEHLLPAFTDGPLPASAADDRLAERLAGLELRTARSRQWGDPLMLPAGTFTPAPHGPTSQRPLTRVDIDGGRMTLHEDIGTTEVALTEEWSVAGDIAASATTLDDGRLAVDIAFLATPHRLEVEVEPAAGTFATRWAGFPLFGAGLKGRLTSLHAPE